MKTAIVTTMITLGRRDSDDWHDGKHWVLTPQRTPGCCILCRVWHDESMTHDDGDTVRQSSSVPKARAADDACA